MRYPYYGGRGIRVYERWLDFRVFFKDMGPRPSKLHSLERKDNNGNYEPGNCRWATHIEQMRNKRSNRLITFKGRTLPLSAWAESIGVSTKVLWARLHAGWSLAKALTTPLLRQNYATKL
jgi:hypothetical protein